MLSLYSISGPSVPPLRLATGGLRPCACDERTRGYTCHLTVRGVHVAQIPPVPVVLFLALPVAGLDAETLRERKLVEILTVDPSVLELEEVER